MPLPLILGGIAAAAAAAGVGGAAVGGVKMKKANDLMKSANERHQKNISRMEDKNKRAPPRWIVWVARIGNFAKL